MTYQAFETSQQAGKPVELYKFYYQAAPVMPALAGVAPATGAVGPVVVTNMLLKGVWDTQMLEATESSTYPPASPLSFTLWEAASGYAEVWGAYDGPIGGGQGYYYRRGRFYISDGLATNHVYVLRALVAGFSAFEPHGLEIVAPFGDGNAYGGGSSTSSPAGAFWIDRTFTTGTATDTTVPILEVRFGHFDLEVGYANVVYMYALEVFEVSTSTSSSTTTSTSGGGLTFPLIAQNYTSADVPIVYNGETYVPAMIVRDKIRTDQAEIDKAQLQLRIPLTETIAGWFTTTYLTPAPVQLIMYRLHRDDLTDAGEPFWGQAVHNRVEGEYVVLTFEPGARGFRKIAPRFLIQQQCNNILFDEDCSSNGLSPLSFLFRGTVSAVSPDRYMLTVPGAVAFAGTTNAVPNPGEPTFYEQGVAIADDGRRAQIVSVSPDDVVLLKNPLPFTNPGDVILLEAGCDGFVKTCFNRFGNLAAFRGFPYVPIRNPFVGAGLNP